MRPGDALEVSLAGAANAGVADDLLAVVASLRGASSGIASPTGLRARRGALLAGAAPRVIGPQPVTLSRRLRLALIAATFALVSVLSFAAAGAAISWLREVMPPDPAHQGPTVDADGLPAPPTPDVDAVTPEPTPSPIDVNTLDQPGRLPPEDEVDDREDHETDDGPEDDETGDDD